MRWARWSDEPGGDVYVIPRDALARVRTGALDRRRFDVTPGRSDAPPAAV